ncbi:hypothetical protein M422DRAFT_28046 [Sphaerobolus stellatus SS14]|nr:hypothetical protein M422DRAFT_28046 [Sphaerobolus stellatus SS14]
MDHVAAVASVLPRPLLDALQTIYYNVISLSQHYRSLTKMSYAEAAATLHLEAILPPLISILAIYFALFSLYRTTAFFVRTTIFFVKWGTMLGIIAAGFGYIQSGTLPEPLNSLLNGPTAQKRKTKARRGPKPRVWDSFDQHRRWKEGDRVESSFVAEAGKTAQEVVDKVVETARRAAGQDGWRGVISEFAMRTFIGENSSKTQTKKKDKAGDTRAKAKAKSR